MTPEERNPNQIDACRPGTSATSPDHPAARLAATLIIAVSILLAPAIAVAHDGGARFDAVRGKTDGATDGLPGTTSGDCPPADLEVVLNTGWDQSTGGALIPYGIQNDDDWDVTVDPNGGSTPRDADVITAHPAWLTLPDSRWIAAKKNGVNGSYVYEMCWCMDERFTNPLLSIELRADDEADVRLNGTTVGSTPAGSFNDATPTVVTVTDPTLFVPGENCLEVEVRNTHGVVTGLNLAGTMTATDGLCCGCDADPFFDDASTGVDDTTATIIPVGTDDDEWVVTTDASGGIVPRPATVITPNAAWNTIPGTAWIAANANGPNGHYVYEKCWCFNEVFENPFLSVELLADDRADVYLNGNLLGSTPASFAFQFPSTLISTGDPTLFREGENCLAIDVANTNGVVTGLNAAVTISADKGECCDCTELPSDAEGWWPLSEATGPTAFETVNAHDGTHLEQFAAAPPPTPGPGKVQKALFFDGVDDYVEVPDAPGLNFGAGEDLSIDAWIRTDRPFAQPIVWKIDNTSPALLPGYALYTSNGLLVFDVSDGSNSVSCTSNTFVDDGVWHFVAVTVDRDLPTGIRLYIDGVIDQSCDPTPVPGSLVNTQPLFIGGYGLAPAGTQLWFNGGIDEVELFRRALAYTELEAIFRAGNAGKCPLTPCEESEFPVCDGTCPEGQVCNPSDVGGAGACICEDVAEPCGGTFPVCDGVCDNGLTCQLNADGTDCTCDPIVSACTDTFFPQCNGLCPDPTDICDQVPGTDFCDCFPAETCENSMFPVCDGICPPGQTCRTDSATGCTCEDDIPLSCEDTFYPQCDGVCPDPTDVCQQIPGSDNCECVSTLSCEDTFYPQCDGVCPAEESCEVIPGTDNCECVRRDPVCGDSLFPECDGACPANSTCVETADGCRCDPCIIVVPDPTDILVHLDAAGGIRWTPTECALVHNLYRNTASRLGDLDGDGLADDYGDCYQEDVIGVSAPDTSKPPPGETHWYLVTGENFLGESSLGNTSGGAERPNTGACP